MFIGGGGNLGRARENRSRGVIHLVLDVVNVLIVNVFVVLINDSVDRGPKITTRSFPVSIFLQSALDPAFSHKFVGERLEE